MEDIHQDHITVQIKDREFDIHNLSAYFLVLKIQSSSLSLAVFNSDNDKCLVYEEYTYEPFFGATAALVRLQNIWNQHHFLKAAFWKKVVVVFANNNFTFVPDSLMPEGNQSDFLRLNSKLDSTQSFVSSFQHKSFACSCHFSVYRELQRWLQEIYPSSELSLVHFTSAFLKGISSFSKVAESNTLFLLVSNDLLAGIHLKEGKLQIVNTFKLLSARDFLYYAMFLLEELQIPVKKANLVVWGDLNHDSEHIDMAKSYLNNINFGKRPLHLKFSHAFDELQPHNAFDIFTAYDLAK